MLSGAEIAELKALSTIHADKNSSNSFEWQFQRDKKLVELVEEKVMKDLEERVRELEQQVAELQKKTWQLTPISTPNLPVWPNDPYRTLTPTYPTEYSPYTVTCLNTSRTE